MEKVLKEIKLVEVVRNLGENIYDLYGLYHDAITGFTNNIKMIENAQQYALRALNTSTAYLDTLPFSYTEGDIGEKGTKIFHTSTQGEFKERNKQNHKKMGRMLIVQIYSIWEDFYREEIAKCLDKNKNDIKIDLFGDIAKYRNSIIHKNSKAVRKVNRNKVLKWFEYEDVIDPTTKQIEEMIGLIEKELNNFLAENIKTFIFKNN